MTRSLRSIAIPLATLLAGPAFAQQEASASAPQTEATVLPPAAETATSVRPLLVGDTPELEVKVRRASGETVTLGEVLRGQRTVLIVYRGSW